MASGAPVMTSNTSSLPEVVGDAAILINPYDKEQIADSLARIVRDEDLRAELRKKGAEKVRKFNWSSLLEILWAFITRLIIKKMAKRMIAFVI